MTSYQVHYESIMDQGPDVGKIVHMIAPKIEAKTEQDAIALCKATRPGSFGHWVNRLASEVA